MATNDDRHNRFSTIKNIVSSETMFATFTDILSKIFSLSSPNHLTVIELIKQFKALPSTIRDGIFFECFEEYILCLNEFDNEKQVFVEDNLKNMVALLKEISGDKDSEKLREYSKRIVKLIDDCGTIQKAVYLANISKAFLKREIDKRLFFKLGQCIKMLTEEDLLFLTEKIKERTISGDDDYVDDFRGLGLIYEVNGGFTYSKKAFQLLQYALSPQETNCIPEILPKRSVVTVITKEETTELINDAFNTV